MNRRLQRILYALAVAVVLQAIIMVVGKATEGAEVDTTAAYINRFMSLLGYDFLGGGYIQFLIFLAFFWALFEYKWLADKVSFEKKFLDYELLPNEENVVLDSGDINRIRMRVNEYLSTRTREKKGDYFLLNLIKKACTKFRSDQSISDAFSMVANQTKINIGKVESEHSTLRYLAWAIPSLGFIGTVIGISSALGAISDTDQVVKLLSLAFDTTLLALILSVIVVRLIHRLDEESEDMMSRHEEFVMDNLINKMDVS